MPLPSAKLDDVFRTLSITPLTDPDEFRAFYRDAMNGPRGGDRIGRIRLRLERSRGGMYHKSILMGHSGVGKSTELTRLAMEVKTSFEPIRLNVGKEIDPINFKPFDLVLLMMLELVERTAAPIGQGGSGKHADDSYLRAIWDWFAKEESVITRQTAIGLEAGAGVDAAGSVWQKFLGLSARLKGEIKYAADRKKEVVEYRLQRVSELADLANRLLDECNRLLRQQTGKEWLFIIEDFEKHGYSSEALESLFIGYGGLLKSLQAHMILTAPVALRYSAQGVQLPFEPFLLPDTPVFSAGHQPHAEGRAALREVLCARLDPALLAAGQMDRLIVASGGNLRDLFGAVAEAADLALLAGRDRIQAQDANAAIGKLKNDYKNRLAESPWDATPVPYTEKAARLLSIYRQEPGSDIGDKVLDSLLRARCVQEFNAETWYGVPPLVVEILKAQDHLRADDPGGVE